MLAYIGACRCLYVSNCSKLPYCNKACVTWKRMHKKIASGERGGQHKMSRLVFEGFFGLSHSARQGWELPGPCGVALEYRTASPSLLSTFVQRAKNDAEVVCLVPRPTAGVHIGTSSLAMLTRRSLRRGEDMPIVDKSKTNVSKRGED